MKLALLLAVFMAGATVASAGVVVPLVAPPDWTAEPADPAVGDVLVYVWVEDAQGRGLLSFPIFYAGAGSTLPVDLSLIPPGTYVCVRAWAYSSEMYLRGGTAWMPPGWSNGFAPAEGRCLDVP